MRRQVQVITLDTRSFRDNLTFTRDVEPGCGWLQGPAVGPQCIMPCYSSNGTHNALQGPCKNDYIPNDLSVADGGPAMLGETQWAWLADQLRVAGPKLRVVASSVQFGIEYNGWEGWCVRCCPEVVVHGSCAWQLCMCAFCLAFETLLCRPSFGFCAFLCPRGLKREQTLAVSFFLSQFSAGVRRANLPQEQKRMIDLIRDVHTADPAHGNGVVFISGDVHYAELSRLSPAGLYPLYDVTSSGITQSWPDSEPNANRLGAPMAQNNFGMLEINWAAQPEPTVRMAIKGADGADGLAPLEIALSELSLS